MPRLSSSTTKKSSVIPTQPPQRLKLVLLGDGDVGKSSLMNTFISNEFDSRLAHTVGVEFMTKTLHLANGELRTLEVWDTAGQERFRCLQRPFYRGADICMLVFSVANRKTFENLRTWIQDFQRYAYAHILHFPFVIVGNKIDVEEREVTKSEAENMCRDLQRELLRSQGIDASATTIPPVYPYVETSARNRLNVEEAFMTAARYALSLKADHGPKYTVANSSIKLESGNLKMVTKDKTRPCC